ncbi:MULTISPECIES: hypothetical protein [Pseudomonadota]|uniref:hypothetical protein n=1 Tax=Pseudomonadota TaxID=1224 RepID=UPI00258FBFBC|nr:hypothetical protein [Achromobacter sp.]
MAQEKKNTGRQHERRVTLPLFAEENAILDRLKSKEDIKADTDGLRFALHFYDKYRPMIEVLASFERTMHSMKEELTNEMKNISWRQNANFEISEQVLEAIQKKGK